MKDLHSSSQPDREEWMTVKARLINRLMELAKSAPDADRDAVIAEMQGDMATSRIWLDQAHTCTVRMPWDCD